MNSKEELENLIKVTDTAVWCWNIKKSTKKGSRCKVDWKSAFDDLSNAYWKYRDAVFNERNVVVLATIKTPAFDGCWYLDEELHQIATRQQKAIEILLEGLRFHIHSSKCSSCDLIYKAQKILNGDEK